MDGERKRRKLLLRWEQQKGLCHWCEKPTILIMRPPSQGMRFFLPVPNEATLDHLRSRLHPDRLEPANGEIRLVMACRQCNNERGQAEEAALPKEELHRRSGHSAKGP